MPVYRTPDGKIVEEKTVKEEAAENADMPPPPPADGGDDAGGGMGSAFDAPTERIKDEPDAPPPDAAQADQAESIKEEKAEQAKAETPDEDDRTRLAGARRKVKVEEGEDAGPADAMDDPVVGWLVVVSGPGQGTGIKLGYGANTIGRGSDQRVRLDFGDGQITREKHAIVTYDPRSRKTFVQHGGGKNLTYVGGEPVLQATELANLDEIQIGDTTLRYVSFCGPEFDWQDQEKE
jgi:hypothetical protein